MTILSTLTTLCIFIRHGETDWNVQHKLQGQSPEAQLTEVGKQQAIQVGEALRLPPWSLQDRDIEIWTSDLPRATQTAHLIATTLESTVPHYSDARLREADHGRFEGMVPDEYQNDPDYQKRKLLTPEQKFKIGFDPLQGESSEKVAQRTLEWMHETCTRNPSTIKVVVTHGGPFNALRKQITQDYTLPDATNGEIVAFQWTLDGEISLIRVQ